MTGAVKELDFNVVLEIWWGSQADLDAAMKALPHSHLLDAVRASGAALLHLPTILRLRSWNMTR